MLWLSLVSIKKLISGTKLVNQSAFFYLDFRNKKRGITEGGLLGERDAVIHYWYVAVSCSVSAQCSPPCWETLRGFKNGWKYRSKSSCLSIRNLCWWKKRLTGFPMQSYIIFSTISRVLKIFMPSQWDTFTSPSMGISSDSVYFFRTSAM